jgi:hypothetical protein
LDVFLLIPDTANNPSGFPPESDTAPAQLDGATAQLNITVPAGMLPSLGITRLAAAVSLQVIAVAAGTWVNVTLGTVRDAA